MSLAQSNLATSAGTAPDDLWNVIAGEHGPPVRGIVVHFVEQAAGPGSGLALALLPRPDQHRRDPEELGKDRRADGQAVASGADRGRVIRRRRVRYLYGPDREARFDGNPGPFDFGRRGKRRDDFAAFRRHPSGSQPPDWLDASFH